MAYILLVIESLVHITINIDEKDRLRVILADDGHDISDIADILKISDSTTYNYINDYLKQPSVAGCQKVKLKP